MDTDTGSQIAGNDNYRKEKRMGERAVGDGIRYESD
jgi:hypothetical protein